MAWGGPTSSASSVTLVTVVWWALQRDHLAAPWTPRPDAPAAAQASALALLALAALGVLGTGLAYALQFDVFREVGQQVSSTVTYLIPVVAVLLGVLVLGERLTWAEIAGFVIVLGSAVVIGLPEPRSHIRS